MKTFDHVLVFGAGSSIARYVFPEIKNYSKSQVHIYRKVPKDLVKIDNSATLVSEFNFNHELRSLDLFLSKLGINSPNKLLILNFIGYFGHVERINEITSDLILETMKANLLPFLELVKLLKSAANESVMIGFSGGGIGGPNLERASLGYLGSKGAMGFISEVVSNELQIQGKALTLIAPGPFPSPMQEIIACSTFPEYEQQRRKAELMFKGKTESKRLIDLLKWIIENPSKANGKILSAIHDDLDSIDKIKSFGLLRRIVE